MTTSACEQCNMPKLSRTRVALIVLLGGVSAAGCSSSPSEPEWEGSENLRFSEDARDPTERETEGGWYRFKPKEDPHGTASPLSPGRRSHGFGDADNSP